MATTRETLLTYLPTVPLAVRQRIALDLHETAERVARRRESIEDVIGLDGAVDMLAQEEHVYRVLVRLLAG